MPPPARDLACTRPRRPSRSSCTWSAKRGRLGVVRRQHDHHVRSWQSSRSRASTSRVRWVSNSPSARPRARASGRSTAPLRSVRADARPSTAARCVPIRCRARAARAAARSCATPRICHQQLQRGVLHHTRTGHQRMGPPMIPTSAAGTHRSPGATARRCHGHSTIHGAAVRSSQPRDQLEQRRLAGAAGPYSATNSPAATFIDTPSTARTGSPLPTR